MAVDTVLQKMDMLEKSKLDALLALAGDASDIEALADEKEALLSLADKATELLALLTDGGTT